MSPIFGGFLAGQRRYPPANYSHAAYRPAYSALALVPDRRSCRGLDLVWLGWPRPALRLRPCPSLPGIWDGLRLNTAITLPVGLEAYGAYALGAWLSRAASGLARAFAKRSGVGSLVLGMLGQIAYHLMAAAHAVRAPWPATVLVACMPVVTLGFGAALTHLMRLTDTASLPVTNPLVTPAAVPVVEAAIGTVEIPAIESASKTVVGRTSKGTAKSAAKAAVIVAKTPDISGAELGRRLGLSERSGRRLPRPGLLRSDQGNRIRSPRYSAAYELQGDARQR